MWDCLQKEGVKSYRVDRMGKYDGRMALLKLMYVAFGVFLTRKQFVREGGMGRG